MIEGQEIVNPRTGQRMTFVRLTEDEVLIDSVHPPTDEREPVHLHPKQESGGEVLAGALSSRWTGSGASCARATAS